MHKHAHAWVMKISSPDTHTQRHTDSFQALTREERCLCVEVCLYVDLCLGWNDIITAANETIIPNATHKTFI